MSEIKRKASDYGELSPAFRMIVGLKDNLNGDWGNKKHRFIAYTFNQWSRKKGIRLIVEIAFLWTQGIGDYVICF